MKIILLDYDRVYELQDEQYLVPSNYGDLRGKIITGYEWRLVNDYKGQTHKLLILRVQDEVTALDAKLPDGTIVEINCQDSDCQDSEEFFIEFNGEMNALRGYTCEELDEDIYGSYCIDSDNDEEMPLDPDILLGATIIECYKRGVNTPITIIAKNRVPR